MITAESSERDGVKRRTLETHLFISEVYKNKDPKELRLVRRTPKWAQYIAMMMARANQKMRRRVMIWGNICGVCVVVVN